MKNLLFATLLMTYCCHLKGQMIDDNYIEFNLTDDIPSHLPKGIKKRDSLRTAVLATGVDSLKLTFGSFYWNESKSFWVSLNNGKSKRYSTFHLEKNDSTDLLSYEMEFDIIPYTKMIVFRILQDPNTDTFYYTWLKGAETSRTFVSQDINSPIKLNEPMPMFKVETLDKEEITSNDLLGNWVVINW